MSHYHGAGYRERLQAALGTVAGRAYGAYGAVAVDAVGAEGGSMNEQDESYAEPAAGTTAPAGDTPSVGKAFVLGGRAVFTLAGREHRYTWRVTQGEVAEDGPYAGRPAPWFVSLLTGPDNTSDYTYVGMLDVATGELRLTAKSKLQGSSTPVVAWNWAMPRVWRGESIAPARLYHMGRCGRCGRALTVPASVESGFGPECAARMEGGDA